MPVVSVIMALYNRQDYLAEAIESIQSQTLEDWELVIVDDGSGDNSLPIARAYEAKDKRIKVISQQNKGLAGARQTGLRFATGIYVAVNDDDDLSAPNRLARLVDFMTAHPQAAAVVSQSRSIDAKSRTIGYSHRWWQDKYPKPALLPQDFSAQTIAKKIYTVTDSPSVLFRREMLLSVGGWRTWFRIREDYDLALRLEDKYPVGVFPQPLYIRRRHSKYEQLTGHATYWHYGAAAVVSAFARRHHLPDVVEQGGSLDEALANFSALPHHHIQVLSMAGRESIKSVRTKALFLLWKRSYAELDRQIDRVRNTQALIIEKYPRWSRARLQILFYMWALGRMDYWWWRLLTRSGF
ncbi:MAG: glycosyltransferase family 2 protein [Gammaproteobacteria bacterium]